MYRFVNNKTVAETKLKSSNMLFYGTVREHRPVIDWLNARRRDHNCGCEEILNAKGEVQPQPHFHNCEYIRARNNHIPHAIKLASNADGLDRSHFSREMDSFGRTLL